MLNLINENHETIKIIKQIDSDDINQFVKVIKINDKVLIRKQIINDKKAENELYFMKILKDCSDAIQMKSYGVVMDKYLYFDLEFCQYGSLLSLINLVSLIIL